MSSNWRTPYPLGLTGVRLVHTSPAYRGLEEFFPKGDVIEEGEETGQKVSVYVVYSEWYMYNICIACMHCVIQVGSGRLEN